MKRFDVNTVERQSQFIAQIGHESNRFHAVEENLNYSAEGLLKTFGKYFPNAASTNGYARNPQRIASKVYANRMGNGDEASGEGWQYRGRGLIQVTGKENYTKCGAFLGIDLVGMPEYLKDSKFACLSAGWYWNTHSLNQLADAGDTEGVTRKINGGTNGLLDRTQLKEAAFEVLSVPVIALASDIDAANERSKKRAEQAAQRIAEQEAQRRELGL